MKKQLKLSIFIIIFIIFSKIPSYSMEIEINDGNVKVKTDDGNVVNSKDKNNNNRDIFNNDDISIGEVNSKEFQNNITRKTTLEDVVIIKDGKTKIYHSKSNPENTDGYK